MLRAPHPRRAPYALRASCLLALLWSAAVPAEVTTITGNALADGILSTVIYGAIGLAMAVIGFKVVDRLTPGNLRQQIAEDENRALAIVVGAFILGVCIIIAAVLVG